MPSRSTPVATAIVRETAGNLSDPRAVSPVAGAPPKGVLGCGTAEFVLVLLSRRCRDGGCSENRERGVDDGRILLHRIPRHELTPQAPRLWGLPVMSASPQAAFRLTCASAIAVNFLSVAFSSSRVCCSRVVQSFRPSCFAQATSVPYRVIS